MVCKACGRSTDNENANFCEYCGSSFKDESTINMNGEGEYNQSQYDQPLNEQSQYYQSQDGSEQQPYGEQPYYYQQPYGQPPYQYEEQENSRNKPMTFGNWMATLAITLLLPFVPLVGWIASLVMMCIWAFSKDTNESKKNWARASLIFGAILFVIGIIIMGTFIGSVIASDGFELSDYLNNYSY